MSVEFHSRQKMPQRTAADTELGCKFTLGRKFVTVSQRVLGDEGQQFVGLDGFGLSFRFGHVGQVRIDKRSLLQCIFVYYSGAGLYSSING